jgi:hypothetical protein
MTDITAVLLAINIGTLAAIVYTLRVIVAMERKITKLMEKQGIRDDNIRK